MEQLAAIPVQEQLLQRRQRLEREIGRAGMQTELERLLREVDQALARVASGTYGLCDTCHQNIEPDRLLADPLARFCLDHLPAAEQRALEHDLQLAASIQRALLPPAVFDARGWQAAHHYRPSRIVSGDYCDCVSAGDGAFYFMVGDVTGKGVAASMLMAHLHAMFRTLVTAGLPLGTLMERASRAFCESTLPTHFATLVCGRADADGLVEICNAGHPSPLVITSSRLDSVPSTGLPLGMFGSEQFGVSELHLAVGDCLLLCTDGVLEAEDAAGVQYGPDRLAAVAAATRHLAPAPLVDACARDLAAFANRAVYADDVTLMAVRRVSA